MAAPSDSPAAGNAHGGPSIGRDVHEPARALTAPGPLGRLVRDRVARTEREERVPADLVIMANEISFAHGTGVLMSRVLEEAPPFILVRAFDHWGGGQVVEPIADHVFHRYGQPREVIADFMAACLSSFTVSSILAVCNTREDVVMSLVAKAISGAPLSLWIMDDNCVLNDGIPGELMTELVNAADARFVICDQMRVAYEERFRRPFWILPPLVARRFIKTTPVAYRSDGVRGCIVGNIWHQAWLDAVVAIFSQLDVPIEWYTSSEDLYFLKFDEHTLALAGIRIVASLSHAQIADRVAASTFVLVPSFSGTETDGHAAAIGRLSLPSKMPYVAASAGTPFLVLANGPSGAADFVTHFDLGELVQYDAASVSAAVERLASAGVQRAVRDRAADLAPALDVTGLYSWTRGAAADRRLPDDRLERLFGSAPTDGRWDSTARLG